MFPLIRIFVDFFRKLDNFDDSLLGGGGGVNTHSFVPGEREHLPKPKFTHVYLDIFRYLQFYSITIAKPTEYCDIITPIPRYRKVNVYSRKLDDDAGKILLENRV